jgi:pectinesterase
VVHPDGWDPWRSEEKKKTAYYAEFRNSGVGFQPDKRIDWAHILTEEEARKFTLKTVLGDWDITKE